MMVAMRVSRLLPVTLLVCAACSSPTGPDSSWVTVSEHTACEALSPQYCVGAFGFTVQSDGRFTVGPSDDGATLSGNVSSSELLGLQADAALVAASLTEASVCNATPTIPGVADRLELTEPGQGAVPVYEVRAGSTCYRAGRAPTAKLHDDLTALMEIYYPRPFPVS
jgi:hypothetical protein